ASRSERSGLVPRQHRSIDVDLSQKSDQHEETHGFEPRNGSKQSEKSDDQKGRPEEQAVTRIHEDVHEVRRGEIHLSLNELGRAERAVESLVDEELRQEDQNRRDDDHDTSCEGRSDLTLDESESKIQSRSHQK